MEEKKHTLRENLASLDRIQFFSVLALYSLGVLSIFSAGAGWEGQGGGFAVRQLVWGAISAAAFLVTLQIGHGKFFSWAYRFYFFALILLFGVMLAGLTVKGSQSWFHFGFFRFQPAEFGKIALILVMAKHLCRYPPTGMASFLGSLALAGISGFLVLLQPDMGSTMVYGVTAFVCIVVAGAPWKYPVGLIGLVLGVFPFLWHFLKEYQKMRIRVFLDPWIDPLGAGYNVIQSRIAVGSGGLLGKGFMEGLQSKLRFLPEPHTDFIFSVYCEEFGFIGSIGMLLLFGILFWRLAETAVRTRDSRAKVLLAGISAWIWFQMAESIGMSMGLLPVTGLPLPFVSYGGSSLLALSIALGLAQSVYISTLKTY
ncbi:MAG: rod shape-determining protein RodA [Synergistaceae bacterium]|jgi:rod shape determining protein RodA|uniref:rod shape-determining protein RodA n=1 Tax=Aminivibrio sp. TaxID=1872489 RepID=UPI00169CE981|nr:rod shape-determining protein RodA [Synergistaceae bacterium]NCC56035.1 rod shape-determining protein RodA [Synergistales bacterium]MDD3389732.1 rod shape-determining protein RodA [Synergistaceae bacterium]MDD3690403.1 rod shape-determining protein RodA [Synergistaceae bacterium]MDD4020850.1 rod shape-determining protein RodA [Synergistaceae bacterium]